MKTVTITLTTEQINDLQKAPIYLEHYGNTELNESLEAIWKAIAMASLAAIK